MSTEYKFNNPGEHYFVIYSFVDWLMYDKAQVSRVLLHNAKDLRHLASLGNQKICFLEMENCMKEMLKHLIHLQHWEEKKLLKQISYQTRL